MKCSGVNDGGVIIIFQEIRIKSHLRFLHHKKLLLTILYNKHLRQLRLSLHDVLLKELHRFQLH